MEILTLLFVLFIYFMPALIAYKRGHRNTMPITIINTFAGWTLLGWFMALIWATTSNTRDIKAR